MRERVCGICVSSTALCVCVDMCVYARVYSDLCALQDPIVFICIAIIPLIYVLHRVVHEWNPTNMQMEPHKTVCRRFRDSPDPLEVAEIKFDPRVAEMRIAESPQQQRFVLWHVMRVVLGCV